MATTTIAPFTFQDGERVIRFGRGTAAEAVELFEGPGYALLTTQRAAATAPHVVEAAAAVHHLGGGLVEDLASSLLGQVAGDRIVALGGGRVIDAAKSVAAARGGGVRALAMPTTLSGAEMSRGHRHAHGVDPATPRVRCAIVVNDPALSASAPVSALAASALNALGHCAEAPCTVLANPVATLASHEGARLLVAGFPERGGEPDRDALALGALLAGYALDSAHFGLHHVLAQSLVRVAGLGHGPANAVMLPHSLGALAWRFPRQAAALADALGDDPAEIAARLCDLTGASRLRDLGCEVEALPACAEAAGRRPELDRTPPRADRAELLALYEHAY